MSMTRQSPHPSGRVVSVRLSEHIIQRLDALSERTGRSRGVYLRMAVAALLPLLEDHHWHQQTAAYESRIFEEESRRLTSQLIEEHPAPNTRETPP